MKINGQNLVRICSEMLPCVKEEIKQLVACWRVCVVFRKGRLNAYNLHYLELLTMLMEGKNGEKNFIGRKRHGSHV